MDKYEELKANIKEEITNIENHINDINTSLSFTDTDDMDRLNRLLNSLNYQYDEFRGYYEKYQYIMTHNKEIKALLCDFYQIDDTFYSLIYEPIKIFTYKEKTEYGVRDKYFTTLEESKEYSKSLGEKQYWLRRTYGYINVHCPIKENKSMRRREWNEGITQRMKKGIERE